MTRRTRSVALAGAVVFAIVGLFQVQSVKGQELRNQGLVSAPIVAQPGDTIHITMTNIGRKLIRVTPFVVDPEDLDIVVEVGDTAVLRPRTGASFSHQYVGPGPMFFLVILGLQSAQGGRHIQNVFPQIARGRPGPQGLKLTRRLVSIHCRHFTCGRPPDIIV